MSEPGDRRQRERGLNQRMRAEIALHSAGQVREVRCVVCGRFLFQAAGLGTVVTIKCRCYRLVTLDGQGRVTATPLDAEGERRTA